MSEQTWRTLLDAAAERLGDRADARRIAEEATGCAAAELSARLDERPAALAQARFGSMVDRRARGEPLQYVLGSWGFRRLDVHVDRRVLIPRPETEVVVEHALAAIDEIGARLVVDLGTGSGVIALSIAAERAGVEVWATDRSPAAIAVATANLAGIGRAATRVRLATGDWFGALPAKLRGTIDVVVSNPPYVAAGEVLPDEVASWEPRRALVAGPTGTEAIECILRGAPAWLRPGGVAVVEIGETQGDAVTALARAAGFATVAVHPDLAGRPRVAVAALAG